MCISLSKWFTIHIYICIHLYIYIYINIYVWIYIYTHITGQYNPFTKWDGTPQVKIWADGECLSNGDSQFLQVLAQVCGARDRSGQWPGAQNSSAGEAREGTSQSGISMDFNRFRTDFNGFCLLFFLHCPLLAGWAVVLWGWLMSSSIQRALEDIRTLSPSLGIRRIWRFPKSWGYPQIIHFNGMFPQKTIHFGYPPLSGNLHIWWIKCQDPIGFSIGCCTIEVQELIAVPWLCLQRLSNTALHPTSIEMTSSFMTFHVYCSVNNSEYLRITVWYALPKPFNHVPRRFDAQRRWCQGLEVLPVPKQRLPLLDAQVWVQNSNGTSNDFTLW